MNRKKVFLIDGNSFCYRAYFAIRELSNSKGQPTNAIYGFITMLNRIIEEEKPDYIAVAFDLKGPTFRHRIYEEYKIHRKPMPDELASQLEPIKKILSYYNIMIFEKEGFEADDVLATVSKKLSSGNLADVYIVTGDKDILQLVDNNIKVYNTHKDGLIYDTETVKRDFGVEPSRITDLIALMGDSSDNIPGVPGIGHKTALGLLEEFGSLENLFSNVEKLKNERIKCILKENRDKAFLSRDLAISRIDVPVDFKLDDMRLKEPDKGNLFRIFKELEFKSLLKDFAPGQEEEELDYRLISTKKDFDDFLKKLKGKHVFSFDFETTSTDPMQAEAVGISFSFKAKEAVYIALFNKNECFLEPRYVFNSLKRIFEDASYKKIGQNIKYEAIILRNQGIDLKGIFFDTMVASYLINPSKPNHNLDDISIEYLNTKLTSIDELVGKGKKQLSMKEAELGKVYRYGCQDADITFRLSKILAERLKKYELEDLFYELEIPLIYVLAQMEINGVKLDTKLLNKLSAEMEEKLNGLTDDIYRLSECTFNINSPKQLSDVLFEKLKLPTVKKTKTGYSTDVEVLNELAETHSIAKMLLEYRELSKLKTTYADALPRLINPDTGRIHTSFNQTVAQTGRLSSSNPNLQNIPVKTAEGRKVRKAFIAGTNSSLLISADYSQIELRILAHLSEDEVLIDAFKKGLDIHTHTASLIFDVKEDSVTAGMRDAAKTVNFGIVYGMSPYGLSKDLGIEPQKAKEFIDSYFSRYPKVRVYLDEQINFAREHGFVKTIFNRRRYIHDITSANIQVRQFAERTAINMPIQGSAADLIKLAMIKIYEAIEGKKLDCRLILQVHDELVFDCRKDSVKVSQSIIEEIMEGVVKLKVPIKVSIKSGDNWSGA